MKEKISAQVGSDGPTIELVTPGARMDGPIICPPNCIPHCPPVCPPNTRIPDPLICRPVGGLPRPPRPPLPS